MIQKGLEILKVLRTTISEFLDDECTTLAASLSYYTVFALPPLMYIVVRVIGTVFGEREVQSQIISQIREMVGPAAADQAQTMLARVSEQAAGDGWTLAISLAILAFSAAGVFLQLQNALNRAWNVRPDPTQGGIRNFLLKRFMSLGMTLAVAFILLVSLMVSTAIGAAIRLVTSFPVLKTYLPPVISQGFLYSFDVLLSIAIFPVLFALIFKYIPDAKIKWHDVWVGAIVTTVLFVGGKLGIGFYLGRSDVTERYGAAGALAILMMWVYYVSLLVLLGAEFTQTWARRRGTWVEPAAGATHVVRQEAPVDEKTFHEIEDVECEPEKKRAAEHSPAGGSGG